MPSILFENQTIECNTGENLRKVLLQNRLSPYHTVARVLHCRGLGTCGTCSVEIVGEISPQTKIENWRLSFPPHRPENNLRLACQVSVLGDVEVRKHPGFWGQHKTDAGVV